MTRDFFSSKKLWGLNMIMALVSLGLFVYQDALDDDLDKSRNLATSLHQEITRARHNQNLIKTKAEMLNKMTDKGFITSKIPTYNLIKDQLINAARVRYLEKVRITGGEPSQTQKWHLRPFSVFLQARLDTDAYHFMKDVQENLPGLTTWTFFSLFFTPQGTVQGELQGELYVYEK
jgi:hypothetical protein